MLKLSNFQLLRPAHETDQQTTLEWFVAAHVQAEKTKGNAAFSREAFEQTLLRVGCKPDRITKRGHTSSDYLHQEWDKMEIYNLHENPSGKNLSERLAHFGKHVDGVFETYYPQGSDEPENLIHVSCTGYLAPSGAQKIVSKRHWKTTVTHAYHMGCYASLPALRMAKGFLASAPARVDIVHTEICSIHVAPDNHSLGALVAQTLFADGFIKYSATTSTKQPHFEVVALLEEIIPDSVEAMSWNISHWGFEIALSKEIPVLIRRALHPFLERLAKKAGRDKAELLQKAQCAIHPGGPKILLQIQEALNLSEEQMAWSFEILKLYGNMSSATLPHIWGAMLETVPEGTEVISLAFGPGLSITGSIMVKRCGS